MTKPNASLDKMLAAQIKRQNESMLTRLTQIECEIAEREDERQSIEGHLRRRTGCDCFAMKIKCFGHDTPEIRKIVKDAAAATLDRERSRK